MPLTRAAVIVGSPGHPVQAPPLLVGVQADSNSYLDFLLSDHGGAWSRSEIRALWHPKRQAVKDLLGSLNVDYSITIFAGHGWTDKDTKKAAILLNPDEGLWVSDFRTNAVRQLTIIDACKEEERAPRWLMEDKIARDIGLGRPVDPYTASCRELYDRAIAAVGEQRTIMWGCNIGQTSGEDVDGGYFSHALVRLAGDWAQATSNGRAATSVLDARQAFSKAAEYVRTEHYPQDPQLESGRSPRAFPFAVA